MSPRTESGVVRRRVGLASGAAGVLAAGAAAVVALDRSAARRRRAGAALAASLADWPVERSGRLSVHDGIGLYYEQNGPADAPLTVVFVHGYCLSMGEFCYQRQALIDQFGHGVRLVFYDQRSHGRSDRSSSEYASIDQLGDDLGRLIDTLVPSGPMVLVGHSMGGMTLMALAAARPDLVESDRVLGLALMSTSAGRMAEVTLGLPALVAYVTGPLLPLLLKGARRGGELVERGRAVGSDLAGIFVRRLSFGSSDVDPAAAQYLTSMIAATRIEVVADFYPAIMSHDKLAALKHLVDKDVLIVCGERDILTPLEHSERIAQQLPSSTLVVVPEAGHVMLMEKPDAVTEPLAALVARALRVAETPRRRA